METLWNHSINTQTTTFNLKLRNVITTLPTLKSMIQRHPHKKKYIANSYYSSMVELITTMERNASRRKKLRNVIITTLRTLKSMIQRHHKEKYIANDYYSSIVELIRTMGSNACRKNIHLLFDRALSLNVCTR